MRWLVSLSAAALITASCFGAPAAHRFMAIAGLITRAGLVSWWRPALYADGRDVVGGATATNAGNVQFSTGWAFNSTSAYVSAGSGPFNVSNWTISAWVRIASTNKAAGYIAAKRDASPASGYVLYYNGSNVVAAGTTVAGVSFSGSTAAPWPAYDRWVYLVAILSNATSAIYFDGVLSSAGTNTIPVNNSVPLTIGARTEPFAFFGGKIADFMFYSRSLTAAEIVAGFQYGRKSYELLQ